MPGRKYPLITNEIYHVFNRGINRQPTFTDKREYNRAIESIKFYRFTITPISLSKYLRFDAERQKDVSKIMRKGQTVVKILAYCLMPNHFHLLLQQTGENGISKYMSNFQNSYTRYFNIKHERDGSLFLDQFKAVRIETDEQLIHVTRYIHLNPFTGFLVKTHDELETYPWSSLADYLRVNTDFIDINLVLDLFKDIETYKKFIFDQADYQRALKKIAHLITE